MENVIPKNAEEEKVFESIRDFYNKKWYPSDFANWPINEQNEWMKKRVGDIGLKVPESLNSLIFGYLQPGDCARPLTDTPEWLDVERFARGQKFARKNDLGLIFGVILGNILTFTFDQGTQPLILTRRSSTLIGGFKRYLSTIRRVRTWYIDEPWKPGTQAYENMKITRHYHDQTRKLIEKHTHQDLEKLVEIPNPWCPLRSVLLEDFRAGIKEQDALVRPYILGSQSTEQSKPLTQSEMAVVQFSFMGLIALYPEQCGLGSPTDEELSDFCYLWKVIGYCLGIEDAFNFCAGSWEDVRQKSKDLIEYWIKPNLRNASPEWEHMARCLVNGSGLYFSVLTFDATILFLMENMLNVPMPRLRTSMTYRSLSVYYFYRVMIYLAKLPGMKFFLNLIIDKLIDGAAKLDAKTLKRYQTISDKITPQVKISI